MPLVDQAVEQCQSKKRKAAMLAASQIITNELTDAPQSYNTGMKLLLTNDDGIGAAGLEALLLAARQIGEPVMVAPADAHSGCSHRVTTDEPFRMRRLEEGRFVVHGTPADCVRVGLHSIVPDAAWVLAGINHGGNLGADVYLSGTVAAVREAVLHGRPGIAISHYHRRGAELDWERATQWIVPLLRELTQQSLEPGTFWNVNLPHPEADCRSPEIAYCDLDPSPLPLAFRTENGLFKYSGDYHSRPRRPGHDVDVCFQGKIAVTRLQLFGRTAAADRNNRQRTENSG
jgi:5'-nucleotidase